MVDRDKIDMGWIVRGVGCFACRFLEDKNRTHFRCKLTLEHLRRALEMTIALT